MTRRPGFHSPVQAALPLLERYGTGAFATVKAETAATVKDIGDKLRNTLRNPSASPDDAARTQHFPVPCTLRTPPPRFSNTAAGA